MKWPGIIKYSGDAELVYVDSQIAWDNDIDLHDVNYNESDYLIDSSGELFTLTKKINNHIQPVPNGNSMALVEILGLIKAHAAQRGSCCIAKIYAPTINEAFKIVGSLEEI